MTPFHIRRRVRKALTSLPGPVGSVLAAVLGRPSESATATQIAEKEPPPAPEPSPSPAPDPRERPDEELEPERPSYSPEEEAALKSSRPTPRSDDQKNVIYWQVAKKSDVPPGTGKVVRALDRELALFNVDGEFYAIGNACPHAQGSLGHGELDGKIVTCPDHGWQFDVTTGECVSRPGNRVERVPVRFDGDRILVPV